MKRRVHPVEMVRIIRARIRTPVTHQEVVRRTTPRTTPYVVRTRETVMWPRSARAVRAQAIAMNRRVHPVEMVRIIRARIRTPVTHQEVVRRTTPRTTPYVALLMANVM